MKQISYIICFLFVFLSKGIFAQVTKIISDDLSSNEIKALAKGLGITLGKELDRGLIDENLKRKELADEFGSIQIFLEADSKGREVIRLSAIPIRFIESVDWKSLNDFSLGQSTFNEMVKAGDKLNIEKLKKASRECEQLLLDQGVLEPKVTFATEKGSQENQLKLIVEVKQKGRTTISGVEFVGLPEELLSVFQSQMRLRRGMYFNQSLLAESVAEMEEYLKKHQYFNSEVKWEVKPDSDNKTQVKIVVRVNLGQRYQITFKGNTVLSSNTLREMIDTEIRNLSDVANKIREKIEKRYKSLGYHFVAVSVGERSDLDSRSFFFDVLISEGEKVFIDSILFDGVWREGLPSAQKLFFENATGVIKRRIYWEDGIAESTAQFLSALRKKGFLSVSITGPRVFFSQDKKGVQLFYDLQIGKLYTLKKISFQGLEKLTEGELKTSLGLELGTSVDRSQISSSMDLLRRQIRAKGFLDVSLSSEERLFEFETGQTVEGVELFITIVEGPQYRVGEVTFEGLKKTREKVVEREILLKSGDIFNPDKLAQSEENLSLLGLFGRVESVTSSSTNAPLIKNIVFMLSEIKPGFGEVGIGGLYEDPLFRARSFLGLGYRNLFGLNQTTSLRSEVSLPISRSDVLIPFVEYAAIVNYRAPYFLEAPFAFSVQGGFDSFQVASSADGKRSDLQTKARIEERIEKQISKNLLLQYRLHRLERTRTEEIERSDSGKTQLLNDTVDRIGSTGFLIAADFRNDLFNPTSGHIHQLDLEFAHPHLLSTSELSFLLALQRNTIYIPISRIFSFAIFSGFGWAKALMSASLPEARLANELALGGQGSIRGYAPRLFRAPAGTREVAFYNVRSELSFPLFGEVSGALFFDTGQLFPDLKADARNDGVGLGLRYKTPVGPIVLDLAHGLSPAAESIVRFTFTVGSL